mmetsp:Transcript_15029/g.32391  ORF Transcript_15029/g.32391 Transcript_15029/m.32391 type:complete len:81 (+) Transcript_15029:263-505(+)
MRKRAFTRGSTGTMMQALRRCHLVLKKFDADTLASMPPFTDTIPMQLLAFAAAVAIRPALLAIQASVPYQVGATLSATIP